MQVLDVMTPEVQTVYPDAPIQAAAQMMKSLDVGSVPVCDGKRLLGMVTDRDIAVRAVADAMDPIRTPVGDIMTPDLTYCYADEDVRDASRLMSDRQIRRLPVLSREKQIVGILSLGDIAEDVRDQRLAGETVRHVSTPSEPEG